MQPMRRKDREITDLNAIRTILNSENMLHLALADNSTPYVVPMNYGYEMSPDGKLTLYLHCAHEGRKLDMMMKNPHVCFEISRMVQIVSSETTANWTARYYSIIGQGKVSIDTTAAEREKALMMILRQVGYQGPADIHPGAVAATTTLRIEVESYTAKSSIPAGEEGSAQ